MPHTAPSSFQTTSCSRSTAVRWCTIISLLVNPSPSHNFFSLEARKTKSPINPHENGTTPFGERSVYNNICDAGVNPSPESPQSHQHLFPHLHPHGTRRRSARFKFVGDAATMRKRHNQGTARRATTPNTMGICRSQRASSESPPTSKKMFFSLLRDC